MTKIAYNSEFSSFQLPRESILLARKISGDPRWGGCTLKGERNPGGSIATDDYGFIHYSIPRHDPVLVEVIERLGDRAGSLKLHELPSGTKYFISECDGREIVETIDSIKWIIAP